MQPSMGAGPFKRPFKRPIKRPFKRPTFIYVDPCKLFKFTPMAFLQEEGLQQKGTWGGSWGGTGPRRLSQKLPRVRPKTSADFREGGALLRRTGRLQQKGTWGVPVCSRRWGQGRSSGPRSFTWIHVNYSNLRQWRSSKKRAFTRRAPGGFLGGKRAEAPVSETPNESTQNFRGLLQRCGAPEEDRAPSAEGHLGGSCLQPSMGAAIDGGSRR